MFGAQWEREKLPSGRPRNEQRDLEILKAALAGVPFQLLAEHYGLTPRRVQAIVTALRHKIAVSPSPAYRAFRQSG